MDVAGGLARHRVMVAWSVLLVLLAGLAYALTGEPHLRHSSVLNAVFDARWMIAGSRLLIGVTLVYVLLSVGIRVENGQWVRSAGPIQTDAGPAQAIADSQHDLQLRLQDAQVTIDDLSQRLERSLEPRRTLLGTLSERDQDSQDDVPPPGTGEGPHEQGRDPATAR